MSCRIQHVLLPRRDPDSSEDGGDGGQVDAKMHPVQAQMLALARGSPESCRLGGTWEGSGSATVPVHNPLEPW